MEGLTESYRFVPFTANRLFGSTAHAVLSPLNAYYFAKHFVNWVFLLIRHQPDIAHYPITSYWNLEKSLVFLSLARILGAKTVGHLHGGAFDVFWAHLSSGRKRRALRLAQKLDVLVVLSLQWKEWVQNNLSLPEHKVMIVNNPIDRHFESEALSFQPSHEKTVFFMGSLGQRKGVYDILGVAKMLKERLPTTTFLLAGPEDQTGDLRKIMSFMTREGLGNVKVLKPLYGKEKVDYFERNGVFLFPSYNENLPLVVIEAAASGKPIVVTPVGAVPEFFENEKSVLMVQPGRIDQMADAIVRVIDDTPLKIRLGKAARDVFVRRLSREGIMESLRQVYNRVLQPEHPR
jgi:glycosyltransferase involved in cell wall biosynthesis